MVAVCRVRGDDMWCDVMFMIDVDTSYTWSQKESQGNSPTTTEVLNCGTSMVIQVGK
jgi:hypothetical protein